MELLAYVANASSSCAPLPSKMIENNAGYMPLAADKPLRTGLTWNVVLIYD